MARSIGVISAKGGVGKTISTVNISAALMQMGRDVIVVDADIKASGLGLQLGMFHFPFTLNDVLEDKKRNILEAMYIHSSGLRIIPASLCLRNTRISRLGEVLSHPSIEDNIVMVDAPPGMENNAQAVIRACNEAVIVTLPELPSIADVMKSISVARKSKCNILGLLVNRYRRSKDQITPAEIESACGVPVIGVVPDDKEMLRSVFRGEPCVLMSPYSRAAVRFKEIAAKIAGENYKERGIILKRLLWKLKRK